MNKKEYFVPKKLLITGCQRSGTTLLATALGRHPKINMLWGSISKDVRVLIGKEYAGNKLSAYRQIRFRRATRFDYLANRIISLFRNKEKYKIFPHSKTCIDDYDKIVIIFRNPERVVDSIKRNLLFNEQEARKEFDKADIFMAYVILKRDVNDIYIIYYENLIKDPEFELIRICYWLGLEFDERVLEAPKFCHEYSQDTWDRRRI